MNLIFIASLFVVSNCKPQYSAPSFTIINSTIRFDFWPQLPKGVAITTSEGSITSGIKDEEDTGDNLWDEIEVHEITTPQQAILLKGTFIETAQPISNETLEAQTPNEVTQSIPSPFRSAGKCNAIEREVNAYRNSRGLSSYDCDSKIRDLATWHAYDQTDDGCNQWCSDSCNGHGWHSQKWRVTQLKCPNDPCDCDNDIFQRFKGEGTFISGEISHWNPSGNPAQTAVDGWKDSSGHNELMLSTGQFQKRIGCNHFGKHANCFFGVHWPPA